jgi:lipopolysaccharide/colanic/teichoic acid biosynthesis glycosyltransferase
VWYGVETSLQEADVISAEPTAIPIPENARRGRIRKRIFDIAVSVPLCLLVLPTVVVLCGILAIQHGSANALFVHTRFGYRGRKISVPKLRTLTRTTHPYADKTLVELKPVSRFADFLRRSHLDELPQLFLVPIGRLSLVGPRPCMIDEAIEHSNEHFRQVRTSVPVGCTGLWQVGVANQARVSDAPEYDYFYVEHRTLRMDVWVLWRTLLQMFGASPVRLSHVPRWVMAGETHTPDSSRHSEEVIDLRSVAEGTGRAPGSLVPASSFASAGRQEQVNVGAE